MMYWYQKLDDALATGIYAALAIHGCDVEQWVIDYYIAQAWRDLSRGDV